MPSPWWWGRRTWGPAWGGRLELVLQDVLTGLPGGCEGRADCRGDPWLEVPHHRADDSALAGVAEAGAGLRGEPLGGDKGPGRGDRPGRREGPWGGVEGGCAGGPARGPAGANGRVDSGGDPGLEGANDLGNQVRLGRSRASGSGGCHPGEGLKAEYLVTDNTWRWWRWHRPLQPGAQSRRRGCFWERKVCHSLESV